MTEKLNELKNRLAEISDIQRAAGLLNWDQQVNMPPGGGRARGQQLATLRRIAHEKSTDDAIGQLLEDAATETAGMPYDSDEASLIRVSKRDYIKARRIPASLVAETAEANARAFQAWQQARAVSDYAAFAPFLQRNLDLAKQRAECLGYTDRIYDPLLDSFENEMTTAQVETIFAELKREIVPMVHAIAGKPKMDDSFLHQPFEEHKQWDLSVEVSRVIGYDWDRGRLDRSAHPFTNSFAVGDVRITTRFQPDFFNAAFFATMHETGHALHGQGARSELERTPLLGGGALGTGESQSRTWENVVGRSRAFWKFFMPRAQAAFPIQFRNVDAEKMYRAVNRVQPSLIRVEADEVTYNLHIMIRFELENALLENRVSVNDLPAAWNAKMQEYLGITPPNDAQGVMQDVHWSSGMFGYFPTYSLGNLLAAQWLAQVKREIPDIEARFEQGEFKVLLDWQRKNIHTHGRKFTLNELATRVAGEPLQTRFLVAYLKEKFGEIYGA